MKSRPVDPSILTLQNKSQKYQQISHSNQGSGDEGSPYLSKSPKIPLARVVPQAHTLSIVGEEASTPIRNYGEEDVAITY